MLSLAGGAQDLTLRPAACCARLASSPRHDSMLGEGHVRAGPVVGVVTDRDAEHTNAGADQAVVSPGPNGVPGRTLLFRATVRTGDPAHEPGFGRVQAAMPVSAMYLADCTVAVAPAMTYVAPTLSRRAQRGCAVAGRPIHLINLDHRKYHGRALSLSFSPELLDWFVRSLPSLVSCAADSRGWFGCACSSRRSPWWS